MHVELNEMPCRPPRERVIVNPSAMPPLSPAVPFTASADDEQSPCGSPDALSTHPTDASIIGADDDDVCLPSITTEVDLSDHPLGQ